MSAHAPLDSRDGSQVLSVASSDFSSGQGRATKGNAVPKDAVGLSKSKYSTRQRKLLDLVNKLHNTGSVLRICGTSFKHLLTLFKPCAENPVSNRR